MKITRYAIDHPTYIIILLISLLVFALYFMSGMNTEFVTSDISSPEVYVVAIYPGASASEVEEEVTNILEEDFTTLSEYKEMTSSSFDSYAIVTIKFNDGTDVDKQKEEIRSRLDNLSSSLPTAVEEINVISGGTEMLPIMTIAIDKGDTTNLVTSLSRIKGISSVKEEGNDEKEITVELDSKALTALSISPLTVYQAISYNSLSLPLGSGNYQEKESSLRFNASYSSLDEIKVIPIAATEDGKVIHLDDVASISIKEKESGIEVRRDGEKKSLISIYKRGDGNTLSIIKEAKEILNQDNSLSYVILSDDSRTITSSLSGVVQSGLLGVGVAVLVLLLTLGSIKATLMIAISMPLSILFTFILMKASGITINLLSITGIVIALGSIVDGSIVMLDQIITTYNSSTLTTKESILKSSDKVTSAILGSAITTVVVFIPILFLKGLIKEVLKDVALTFIFAISSSAIVAIIIIPFISSKLLKEKDKEKALKPNLIQRAVLKLMDKYGLAVAWSLSNKAFIMFASMVILVFTIWAIMQLGLAFLPSTDNSEIYAKFSFPSSYSKEEVREKIDEAERIIEENLPEMKEHIVIIGSDATGISLSSDSHKGNIRIELVDVKDRERSVHTIIPSLQYILESNLKDVDISVQNGGFDNLVTMITGSSGYSITLLSDDIDLLLSEAKRVENYLKTDDEVIKTSISSSYDSYTSVIKAVRTNLTSLGVTPYEAGMSASILFNGIEAGSYTYNSDSLDINLTSDLKNSSNINEDLLSSISVITSDKRTIPFSSIASLERNLSIDKIEHSDRSLSVTVSATLTSEDTTKVSNRLNKYLEENPLNNKVKRESAGMLKLMEDSITPLLSTLVISIFLVYIVMVFQFERFTQPLLILLSIPFCIIGVAIGLLLFNSSLNIISMLGVIALVGTAVNNGIILMDYMNKTYKELRKEEDESIALLDKAIISASKERLRSILMTTLTTMLGVLPMAMSAGEGSELYAPLGQVIAGGLIATTLVSLFVMPVLYRLLEGRRIKKK